MVQASGTGDAPAASAAAIAPAIGTEVPRMASSSAGPVLQPREAAGLDKVRPAGGAWREGVRLVQEAADGDARSHARLPVNGMLAESETRIRVMQMPRERVGQPGSQVGPVTSTMPELAGSVSV